MSSLLIQTGLDFSINFTLLFYIQSISMAKPYTVLFLGSLAHSDETSFLDKTRPHQDQIDFQDSVRIDLIRIPRPGKDIYSRHISITQSQTIKNFQIYYRNLQKSSGRYSLLISNNELLASSTDDILITPKQPIFTDLLLIKGNFTKITFCIYGNLLTEQSRQEKCPHYSSNVPIEPILQSLIQIKKDVFEEKRQVIREIQNSIDAENNVEDWHSVVNDDGINEQQIENICNLSQKLLTTFTSQQLSQQSFVVQFRSGLEEISANLAKIFKNKHLGLYYPTYEDSNISSELPIRVTSLAINSLDLSLSEQFRGLQILKFSLQLDRHADFFIQSNGVEKLIRIFVDFFRLNSVVLSTYRNLVIEVLICISHWRKAIPHFTQIMKDTYYHQLFQQKVVGEKEKPEQRERSRQKKTRKSRSDSQSSSSNQEKKKKKKDKLRKRNKSKQKQKQKKKGKQSKSKQQVLKKVQEIEQPTVAKPMSLKEQLPNLSFYQILLFQLSRQTNSKQLTLIKILSEQILQTVTKSKVASERVALSTSLLKDLKYIFNPAGQILNTKSLKQFASCYQPFLNNIQSQGVDSDIVSEREKLKNMRKYGISPKICKIINTISLQIASSQCHQNQEESKTPFDSSFIVLMSELIRHKEKSVLYGFGRILTTFKIGSSNDIIYLKKIEAAMTMISQYIYKILVQDNGLYTVLNIDQIYTSLINITNCLSKDASAFTKELKRKIRQLTNYAMAYDLFNRSEGNFKTISDYFLRLFKFEHYQINKINDFKKKQFQKLTRPYTVQNLSEAANLGSFHELFPEQPLLQIDVYLKIFNVLLQYNKNVWALFYQNKLLCGFSVLYIKLSNIVIFLLSPSSERQSVLINMKKIHLTMQNYLNVLQRLMNILAKKSQYESAFNDLIDEDNFQSVQLYEKSFELYVSVFNALYQKSALLSHKSKIIAQQVLSLILQIYDKLLQSYELTSHASRQSKIKQLWYMIYENHYFNLKSRAACLSLFAFFIQTMQNASVKLFNTYCIEEHLRLQIESYSSVKGHLPKNEKSIIQNLILSNIFRNDPMIQTNLCFLIKSLLQKNSEKNPTCEKVSPYLEDIFDNIDIKLKEKGNCNFQSKQELVTLEKMVLFTDILRKLNCSLASKLQQKLLKYLKTVDAIKRNLISEQHVLQQTAFKLSLKIKINIFSFLKRSFSQKQEHPQILYLIQLLNRNLELSQKITKSIQNNQIQSLSQIQFEIEKESLNLINTSLEVVCSFSSNPYNQSVLLYQVFLQRPYKPVPQLSLVNLFGKLSSPEFVKFITSEDNQMALQGKIQGHTSEQSEIRKIFKQILTRLVYFLCALTSIQSQQFYSTESRRTAIISILVDEKQFPFSKLQQFKPIVPRQFLQTLRDYFAYPIIQKPLSLRCEQKVQVVRNKGYVFSKSIFSIIMEGEPTAKSRYPYIGGPWKSGDIASNVLYTPSRQRDYLKMVKKSCKRLQFLKDKIESTLTSNLQITRQNNRQIQQFQLNTRKRTKNIDKKSFIDTQIKLLNIPLVLQNKNGTSRIEHNQMLKKISPSPSNKYPNMGYSKPTGAQYEGSVRRVSPSPPTNKLPPQNMIGFNNSIGSQSLGQYGSHSYQNQSNSGSSVITSMGGSVPSQPLGTPISISPGHLNIDANSPLKPYSHYTNSNNTPMETPTYPNPYYGGNPQIKLPDSQTGQMGTLPYLQIQKSNSQQLRGSSNSASRQNVPYGGNTSYSQEPYYGNASNYGHQNPKMGGYDNRPNTGYQRNYPPNQIPNYIPNQRYNNPNTPGSYYSQASQPVTGGYGGNYGTMGGSMPRQGNYQNMGNRQYTTNNPQYNYGNYANQPVTNPNYTVNTYSNPNYGQNVQEERQFNEAILLVTQLRGTLPEHLKLEKKNRLNQILVNNVRIQNRVKEYINSLK